MELLVLQLGISLEIAHLWQMFQGRVFWKWQQGVTIMKTITRAGLSRRNIIIHRKGSRFMYYYRKAIDRGYVVLWAGDGMICLTN